MVECKNDLASEAGCPGESETCHMQAKSSPYRDFAERLHKAFDRTKIKPGRSRVTEVATHFVVSRETSRLWFAGSAMPELQRLIELADFCDVSLDWLATGHGSIQKVRGTNMHEAAAGYGESLSTDERLVVDAMRAMQQHKRQGLVAFLSS
jgi:hypothetical protein